MHTTPFAPCSLLDRASALAAAGLITLSVLAGLGGIADHQVDEAQLLAQAAAILPA